MRKYIILTTFVLLLTACGTADQDPGNLSEVSDHDIHLANNQLGFELLKTIEPDQNGNTFISPTSLFMALSMVYNGAEGETKQEIAETLQMDGIEVEQLNQANALLIAMMTDDSREVELNIGNSIWLNDQFQFQADFNDVNQTYFEAEVNEIDVANADSVDLINDWVKVATNEKIDKIVDAPLDPNLVTMLINAIYFQGEWTKEFNQTETAEHPFHLENGSTIDLPLMKLSGELMVLDHRNFQAVSLPYGEDEAMSMQIFLPKENHRIKEFLADLTNESWQEWRAKFEPQQGMLMLPKFQLEYEASLNHALKALGMTTAFDENKANFGKIIEEDVPLWISEVKQKTFIDVNEAGTEAAGVTSVEIETTSAPVDPPFEMKVDRPFFITITDEETEVILFVGAILNP